MASRSGHFQSPAVGRREALLFALLACSGCGLFSGGRRFESPSLHVGGYPPPPPWVAPAALNVTRLEIRADSCVGDPVALERAAREELVALLARSGRFRLGRGAEVTAAGAGALAADSGPRSTLALEIRSLEILWSGGPRATVRAELALRLFFDSRPEPAAEFAGPVSFEEFVGVLGLSPALPGGHCGFRMSLQGARHALRLVIDGALRHVLPAVDARAARAGGGLAPLGSGG